MDPTLQEILEALKQRPIQLDALEVVLQAEIDTRQRHFLVLEASDILDLKSNPKALDKAQIEERCHGDPKVPTAFEMIDSSPHPIATLPAAYVMLVVHESRIVHSSWIRVTPPGTNPY